MKIEKLRRVGRKRKDTKMEKEGREGRTRKVNGWKMMGGKGGMEEER